MIDWSQYPNFSERELACKCNCQRADMNIHFMRQLQALRTAYGDPMVITSGYRCRDHNDAIGGGPAHVLGRAVDVAIDRGAAHEFTKLALLHGFSGIGFKQHGENRFIHIDNLTDREAVPRPTIWSYF